MKERITITLTGETEAGSAEVQPARDNPSKATNGRWGGRNYLPPLITPKTIPSLAMPAKNLLAEGKKCLLSVKYVCPFHTEPIQSGP